MYILPPAFHLSGCSHFITVRVHHYTNGYNERLPCGFLLVPQFIVAGTRFPVLVLSQGAYSRHIGFRSKWATDFIYCHVFHGRHRTVLIFAIRIKNYAVGILYKQEGKHFIPTDVFNTSKQPGT